MAVKYIHFYCQDDIKYGSHDNNYKSDRTQYNLCIILLFLLPTVNMEEGTWENRRKTSHKNTED